MGAVRSFEDLWVWQEARGLVHDVYGDFGPGTIAERDFGFRGQVQKAAVSIMNNIAEGFERSSTAEYVRLLDIAKGSCGEVRSMYYTAEDLQYVSRDAASHRRQKSKRISSGIASMQRRLRQRTANQHVAEKRVRPSK